MEEQIFQGPDWKNQHRISMMEEGEMKRLFLNGHPYMNWPTEDDLSPRLAMRRSKADWIHGVSM